MSQGDDASVRGLRATINVELDHLERLEFHAAEVSQILDQIVPLQQLVFAASNHPSAPLMTAALGQIKEGLEILYGGVQGFRDNAVDYLAYL